MREAIHRERILDLSSTKTAGTLSDAAPPIKSACPGSTPLAAPQRNRFAAVDSKVP
jgi:hypothetical protein